MRWTQKPPLGTQINWAHPLAKGLVGCWLFNEAGGDKLFDLSGNGNDATLTSMAFPPTTSSGWNPGKDGPCLRFDGSDDVGEATIPPGIDAGSPVTAILRIKNLGTVNDLTGFFNLQAGAANWQNVFNVYFDEDTYNGVLVGHKAIAGYGRKAATLVDTASWFDLAITNVGGLVRSNIYIDGCENATDVDAALTHFGDGVIQFGRGITDYYANCAIEYCYVFNRVLTAQEILEHYENPYAMFEWSMAPLLVSIIIGSVAWGHVTGVLETNTRTFLGNWTGTGHIERVGDDEQIAVASGQYMEGEVVNTGAGLYEIDQNFYQAGDDVILKFKHGATQAACEAAAFGAYTVPFDSLGFVQIRIESTL